MLPDAFAGRHPQHAPPRWQPATCRLSAGRRRKPDLGDTRCHRYGRRLAAIGVSMQRPGSVSGLVKRARKSSRRPGPPGSPPVTAKRLRLSTHLAWKTTFWYGVRPPTCSPTANSVVSCWQPPGAGSGDAIAESAHRRAGRIVAVAQAPSSRPHARVTWTPLSWRCGGVFPRLRRNRDRHPCRKPERRHVCIHDRK